jgi:serine/threonine protein kinase
LPTASAQGFGPVLKDRYQLVSHLGKGGMGSVYLAEDTTLFGRKWVVKEMLLPSDPADQPEAEKNFQMEAQLLSQLKHERIPTITEFFPQANKYYIVMEWVEGQDLEKRLQALGAPMSEREVIGYALQVAEILEYLGQQNPPVIHRDVKPANLIVDARGHVHLVDFGIARAKKFSGAFVSKDSQLWGTQGYAPPEQVTGLTEPRSDLYALGATMHHLLTNRDPRDPQHKGFDPLQTLVPTISPPLAQLVTFMLNVDVSKRPTATAAHKQLEILANVEPLVFPQNDLAYTLQDFVQLCDKHWDIALQYLKQRHVEDWLKKIGRLDLHIQARQIRTDVNRRKKSVDPDQALEELLRAMDPTRTAATLTVSPANQIITIVEGAEISVSLTAKSNGRYVNGTIQIRPGGMTSTATLFECKAPTFTTALLVQFKPQPTTLAQRAEILLEGRFAKSSATVNYVQVPPLRFRSGAIVRRVPELANSALTNWNDALYHFQNGDIERWFQKWQRADLGTRAAQLKPQGERGLAELLYLAQPSLTPPTISFSQTRLDFGSINKGETAQTTLTLTNPTDGVLCAMLTATGIEIEPRELVLLPRQARAIRVRVATQNLSGNQAGQPHTTVLEIVSNAVPPPAPLPISFRVVHVPILYVTEKRLHVRLNVPSPRTQIEIRNSGGDILVGSATTTTWWLKPVSTTNFNLPSGAQAQIAFGIDPTALRAGESGVGSVQVTSNGGQINVAIEITAQRRFPLAVFLGSLLSIVLLTAVCVLLTALTESTNPTALLLTGGFVFSVGLIVSSAGTMYLYLRS